MTTTAKPLIDPKQAEVAQTTQYTTPANIRTIIDKFSGTNTTGAAQTITVFLVKSGNTPVAGNTITSAQSIGAGSAYTFPELIGHVLNPGDFIATSSSGVAITIRASGREVTV